MTRRKPPGVSWESWIDRQIREGRERGDFDALAGSGKPIADLDRPHDEMWWVRKKLREEGASFLPPALALRKDREDTLDRVAAAASEAEVRRLLSELNTRIRQVNRLSASGPPSTVMPVDIDRELLRWRQRRSGHVLEHVLDNDVLPERPGARG